MKLHEFHRLQIGDRLESKGRVGYIGAAKHHTLGYVTTICLVFKDENNIDEEWSEDFTETEASEIHIPERPSIICDNCECETIIHLEIKQHWTTNTQYRREQWWAEAWYDCQHCGTRIDTATDNK